ncbi:hypothetical protein AOPFMNJM_1677 [Methylobacterium jeotgali]|uniref:Terminase n=9 Tax=Pseudomonadota TaxID=1224 RepID=A0ABQ4SVU3_9HYPH|nr:hypothetical protein AOPFMNJM_1677 [Methylobacterium jeotgali]
MTDVPVLAGDVSLWEWTTPGPVATAYLQSKSPLDFIMGPAGSGKTTTSVVKCALNTLQMPVCKDGTIRALGCVVRDNYRTLYRTTLETWFRIFPRNFPGSHFEGGQDRPAKHRITFRTPRGQLVEMTVDFYAVGDHAIEDLLKGYEPSWAWINEADLLHERVATFLYGRTGRNPPRSSLQDPQALIPRQVFADLNPPDVDHWIYRDFVEKPIDGYQLHQQPDGLSDAAENRQGASRAYYEEMARLLPERDVVRFVNGRFGYSLSGKPVYPEFNEAVHCSPTPLVPVPQLPLHAGYDQGLSPAGLLFQQMPNGQLRFYGEVVPDHGTGPARFSEQWAALLQEPRFRGCPPGAHTADPAGFYGADRQAGELAWAETVSRAIGIPIMPAPTQEPGIRIESLRIPMTTAIDGRIPGLLLDPSCRKLRSGLAAQYKYPRQRQDARDVYGDRPVKNEWSHPCEAAQYGVLGVRGRAGIINSAAQAGRPGNVIPIDTGRRQPTDFNVWET